MANEDLTTYTEVDIGANRITSITAARVTYLNLDRDETVYLYKDFGVDFFDGDFTFSMTIHRTDEQSASDLTGFLALWNALGAINPLDQADEPGISGSWQAHEIRLRVYDAGSNENNDVTAETYPEPTTRYIEMERDEAVGTFGTVYLRIYTDEARTALEDTLSALAPTAKYDYRYAYALQSFGEGANRDSDGYNENLDLDAGVAAGPSVALLRRRGRA